MRELTRFTYLTSDVMILRHDSEALIPCRSHLDKSAMSYTFLFEFFIDLSIPEDNSLLEALKKTNPPIFEIFLRFGKFLSHNFIKKIRKIPKWLNSVNSR